MTTVPVQLPPDIEQKLQAKAVSVGLTLEGYIRRLAENDAVNGSHADAPTNPLGLEQWEGIVVGTLGREVISEEPHPQEQVSLPRFPGAVFGTLSREEIYEDVG